MSIFVLAAPLWGWLLIHSAVMERILPHVTNETGRLKTVVLGLPYSIGPIPTLQETYDAKSYEAVQLGCFPSQADIIHEMDAVLAVLERYGIEVLRPAPLEDYNQVFARDVAFTIEDTLFISNLIPDRGLETEAFGRSVFPRIAEGHLETLPERVHTEGGDILLYDDIIFVGTYLGEDYSSYKTERTNHYALDWFRERFPHKQIIPIELRKHDHDPRQSVLHLDCAFQPVSRGRALIYPEGFMHQRDVALMEEIFGKDQLFRVTPDEAYHMSTNVVSLSPEALISDRHFVRLNEHLRSVWGMTVEEVPYQEISKMGGLLRCSTMPLRRE